MYEEHQRKEIKCIKKILSLLPVLSMFPLCTHISHSLICWIKKKNQKTDSRSVNSNIYCSSV